MKQQGPLSNTSNNRWVSFVITIPTFDIYKVWSLWFYYNLSNLTNGAVVFDVFSINEGYEFGFN